MSNLIVEKIAGEKFITYQGKELVLVTTVTGEQVWIPKSQYNPNAETVSYKKLLKGEEYSTRDGKKGKLQADRNEFVAAGKVQKYSVLEVMDHLIAKGVTPTFAS